jgi:ADP-ribose pyrophosphatase YjhB (NUDIX family)
MNDITIKVRLILDKEGQVLLLLQKKKNGGNYTLVGGTVEKTESCKDALIRESKEESGLDIKADDLELVHILHKRTSDNRHRVTLYFKANNWSGTIRAKEPEKFKDAAWHSITALPVNTSETVRHVLNEYFQGRLYSEFKK